MAIAPRWRKILRDLWHNKIRTLLVILSIAVGVFAVGVIISTQIMLEEDMTCAYHATNPASAFLYPESFDDSLIETIRRMDGIAEAEGRVDGANLRLKVGPDKWVPLRVDALGDYDDIRLNLVTPISGAWPPPQKGLLVERQGLYLTNAQVGDEVEVETPDGKIRHLRLAGLAYDMANEPAQFSGNVYGYVTLETLEWLGFDREYDELAIQVSEKADDKDHIQAIADQVENKIEKSGRNVYWTWIPNPGEHPAKESIDPLLLILGVLGALSLLLSGFLVINTISAILAQQVKQIGIMKAVGAQARQVIQMYLVMVLAFGLLSLLVAVPLGAWAAYAFTAYLAGLVNFDLSGFRIPLPALAVEITVG
ncbi:MAG: ABC transporter permease, partial [Dehalococcoidia bacterium]